MIEKVSRRTIHVRAFRIAIFKRNELFLCLHLIEILIAYRPVQSVAPSSGAIRRKKREGLRARRGGVAMMGDAFFTLRVKRFGEFCAEQTMVFPAHRRPEKRDAYRPVKTL
ncbi:hypothetical protein [Thauera aminoaromatica]|uniref:hypothetical protein n=1 Tax=Thauera aminoaromatica TaxID=164330 RepID=UPI00118609FF|nr:hypothetical protein [Thauera aminoaromatica]